MPNFQLQAKATICFTVEAETEEAAIVAGQKFVDALKGGTYLPDYDEFQSLLGAPATIHTTGDAGLEVSHA